MKGTLLASLEHTAPSKAQTQQGQRFAAQPS